MDVREKLVELLQDQNNPVWRWFPNNMAMMQLADYLIESGVTVQHGRWRFGKDLPDSFGSINKNKYHLYCSECRNQAFNKTVDNDPDFDVDTPFCPWCGAKMNKDDRP